ncbi:dual specificity protein phosphatase MPK-4-like, partial [Sitophilus oryzae]
FVSQLKLYRHMGYTIEKSDKRYKLFRLNTAADWMRKVKILPQDFKDLIQPDPGLPQSNPDPNVYRCKKCRRVLACEHNLIIHLNSAKSKCSQMYFVEPMAWMNVSQVTQGKLHCPKCSNKVGSFSWVMGCQCPCGVKVAPAFYLVPSKIDYTNVVKNIEVTF